MIAEFENPGNAGIKAFQGKWAIRDDLDNALVESEVRFTSDTPYVTAEGIKSPHGISPGETVFIITQGVRGEADKVFATAKENIGALSIWTPSGGTLSATNLDEFRVKKKITFAVEKIVKQ